MRRISLIIGIYLLASAAFADVGAKVVDAHGTVEKRSGAADAAWQSVNVGDMLSPGSTIRTGENAAVLLQLPDKHTFRIGEASTVALRELGENKSFSFAVVKGRIWSFVNKAKKPAKYEVETASMVLGVSGTLFSVSHDEAAGASDVSVDDGEVRVRHGDVTHRMERGWQIRLEREATQPARPQRHDNPTREMWRNMRDREGWTRPAANPRLNPQMEQRLQDLNRQRLELQRQQIEQQKQRQEAAEALRNSPAIQRQQQIQRAVDTTATKANTAGTAR